MNFYKLYILNIFVFYRPSNILIVLLIFLNKSFQVFTFKIFYLLLVLKLK